jgi:hypothetical protein
MPWRIVDRFNAFRTCDNCEAINIAIIIDHIDSGKSEYYCVNHMPDNERRKADDSTNPN